MAAATPRKSRPTKSAKWVKSPQLLLLGGGVMVLLLSGVGYALCRPAAKAAPAPSASAPASAAPAPLPEIKPAPIDISDVNKADKSMWRLEKAHREAYKAAEKMQGTEAEKAAYLAKIDQQTAQALEAFLESARKQWEVMPPDQRKALVMGAVGKAQEVKDKFYNLPAEKQAQWRERFHSAQNQAWVNKMSHMFLNDLKPEERQVMAPIVKEWVNLFQSL